MAKNAGTLEILGRELALALVPLDERLRDGGAELLLAELGLGLPPGGSAVGQLPGAISQAATAAAALPEPIGRLADALGEDDLGRIVAAGKELFAKVKAVVEAIRAIASALEAARNAYEGLSDEQRETIRVFALALPRKLLDYLVVEYLHSRFPGFAADLALIGLVDRVEEPGTPGDPVRPPYLRRTLHFERLAVLLTDPQAFFRTVYGWGAPAFDGRELFTRLERFLDELGLPAMAIFAEGEPAIFEGYLFSLRVRPDLAPPGLELRLRFPGTMEIERNYPLGGGTWALHTAGSGQFAAGVTGTVAPPLRVSLQPPSGSLDVAGEIGIRGGDGATPFVLFGQAGASRIEALRVSADLGFEAHLDTTGRAAGEPTLEAEVKGGKVRIDTSGADGFLKSLLGGAKLEAGFDLAARWSPSTGLRFTGGAGAEIELPVRLDLGPVDIQGMTLGLATSQETPLRIEAGFALRGALGPIRLSVDRVGVAADLAFPEGGGNLGPAELDFAFLGPRGVGLAIEAGPVAGGGFLAVDTAKGRYAGALQLKLGGLALKAVGLLDTRLPDGSPIVMPDGRPGFSLLLVISGEFTPIQLGYGFTLNAVGGLLGANRTAAVEVLRAGVRDGSLEAVLFPRDPVGEAPKILAVLARSFPVALGRFILGPMARLGWGTPTLLTFDLALLLELPSPLRLVALGRLRMALPEERAAIVRIRMDVLGVVDFGRSEASIDATLYDSMVAGYSISGDMALRAGWGKNPAFALSAGGFHPRFEPPPGFPELRRLAIALSTGDNPRLRLESYLALTANTVQFGARLEVYAKEAGFTVEGLLAFDALLQLDPFGFLVDLVAAAAVKKGKTTLLSADLYVTLSGPRPWHARGRASFKALFLKVSVRFDVRIGKGAPPPPPLPVNVAERLAQALGDPRSWTAQLPPTGRTLAMFRTVAAGDNEIVAHPLGGVGFSQRVAPLGVRMARYGAAPIVGPDRFDVAEVCFGSADLDTVQEVREHFAPAQFFDLSDDDKLSLPSFQPMVAGLRLATSGPTCESSRLELAPTGYEDVEVDEANLAQREPETAERGFFSLPRGGFLSVPGEGPLNVERGLSSGGRRGLNLDPPSIPIEVRDTAYRVADPVAPDADLGFAAVETASGAPLSYPEAAERLREMRAADPTRTERLRVVVAAGGKP